VGAGENSIAQPIAPRLSIMKAIIISPEARSDLNDYYNYVAQTNQDAALELFDSARKTFADLARLPGMGKRYTIPNNPQHELKQWHIKGFRKYLIFYRVQENAIEIVRILHSSQDIDRILKQL
jgi:toxin ParE1/3/4